MPLFTSSTSYTHFTTVKNNIPDWIIRASPDTHRALRGASLQAPDWFEKARPAMPDIAQQLQRAYATWLIDQQQVNPLLARLPSPDVFATPLLEVAIEQRFGLAVDVRTDYLLHARQRYSKQTLLQAALQNFEAREAKPGGLDNGGYSKPVIHRAVPGLEHKNPVLAIAPEQFADLCRTLDLGGKYKALLASVLEPASSPGDGPGVAAANVRGYFKLFEASAFTLQVHIARMKELISPGLHGALLELARNKSVVHLDDEALACNFLQLWDVPLTGIVAIGRNLEASNHVEKIVVYVPDDPFHPLKEYDSTLHFIDELRDRLLQPGYMDFFQRFIPASQRHHLLNKFQEVFYPKVWNKQQGWFEQVLDKNAKLHLRAEAISEPFLSGLCHQKIAVLKDDGLFHAVPTAVEDHKSLEDKLRYFAGKTFQVLNIAAFVVPVLGEIMLAVTAAQLCYEVYEGVESLALGEKAQAWGYLMDVVENVALMAALGAASSGAAGIAAVKAPELVEGMHAVELPGGGTRLWKPDLAPFAHDIVLPADLKPNALGLYEYRGEQWLALEDRIYGVKLPTGDLPYRLQHPTRPGAYEPKLRHNEAGAWLHELDQPLDWQGPTLFRRLGRAAAQCSDTTANRIMRVSDTSEAVLRRVLAEGERPPALLDDTLRRFWLDQELAGETPQRRSELFQAGYQALQASDADGASLMQRVYPELPTPVVEELLRHASPQELQQLKLDQRVPIRLAEEVRVYQQQVRLTRAYEGLYLESVHNPETDRLLLHSLETLPGWSPEVRLEVRDGSFHGPLIDSIGATEAPIRKILIRDADTYQAHDADDQHLHGRDDLYAAVMHALPDAQRQALGLHHVGQGAELKRMLQARPLLPRQTLAKVLQMQLRKPGSPSPMRLADGRMGYILSGRGALPGFIVRETLLDKLAVLALPEPPENILAALENTGLSREDINQRLDQLLTEHQALRASLDDWAATATSRPATSPAQALSRERIGEALWDHWQTSSLPEIGRDAGRLRLQSVILTDLPTQLPDFVLERVRALELQDVSVDVSRYIDDDQTLAQFFQRFPRVTSLTISRNHALRAMPPLTFGLVGRIVENLPRLTELRLLDEHLVVSQSDIDNFARLEHLRTLDLSGNYVFSGLNFVPMPNETLDLSVLHLDYLGLERTALNRVPTWLDGRTTEHIAELSLANNQITSLPEHMLHGDSTSGAHTRVLVRGNVLSRGTIISARLRDTAPRRRFSFDLDVPPALEANLNELLRQQSELHDSVTSWAEASSSTNPLSEAQASARREIGETLEAFWRSTGDDRGLSLLELNAIDINDFPRHLPEFFTQRVHYMELEGVTADAGQLGGFLRRFPRLQDLTVRGRATPLAQLPAALLELPSLSTLRWLNQDLVIDQRAIDFFARLPSLTHLQLDENSLGIITDISGLAARRLRWLGLNNVGMQTWPAWLSELLPADMETLNLEDNQLTELPEHLLQNPRSDNSHTEISLLGNPLTHETMRRAHTSENHGRTYSFAMDLPNDILALDYDTHSSDSEGSEFDFFPRHTHGQHEPAWHEANTVEPWLAGAVEEEPRYREVWQALENGGDAEDLLSLIGRLQHTADYRTRPNRAELVRRVWQVLEAAAQNTELRLTLNGMSEEPLRLLRDYDTCPDGIRLEFNQMEVLIYKGKTVNRS